MEGSVIAMCTGGGKIAKEVSQWVGVRYFKGATAKNNHLGYFILTSITLLPEQATSSAKCGS